MTQYIDKAAVVAEIENWKQHTLKCGYAGQGEYEEGNKQGRLDTCEKILSSLDTLEVKEVDLDLQRFAKEMDAIFALPSSETKNTEEEPLNWEFAIAKHFFELGLKEQKGGKK